MEVSFLSDNVKELLCSTNTELLSSPTCHLQLPQGTIQWKSLQHVFKDLDQLPPDYTEHVQKLAPVCFKISSWLKTQNIEDLKEKYSKHLQWTGQPEVFYECFDVLQSNNACSTHVSLLLLTATLERAMGDVYLTKNSPCPSMLKDLLAAPELCLLFGCTAIKMLHILIGPPTSLNLRNIFWHGFASPGEIPIMYAYFLIIIAVSLGEVLCSNHELVQIPHRQWFTFSNINLTKQTTTVIENVEKDELMAIIYNSNFIQKNMICLWEQALQYYYSGRFGLFLMLLLPQMEMGVRTVFVQANNCPHRLVTAEMLCLQVEDGKKNALIAKVGESYMEMLMDLLVYKEGPRLRNHLSHGEINFYQVDKETADFVLYVCLSWACLFLNTDFTDTKTNGMMEKLKIHGQDYKSIFHYKVVLKRMLIKLFTTLKKWQGIELPTIDQLICKKNATDDKLNEMLSQVIQQIVNNFTQLSSVDRLLLANHDLSTLEILCENICLSTLFRPKIEQEVTTILQKIVHQSQCISENILQITSLRYEQLSKKELRSRQRKNYSILISSIPTILNALNLVSFIVVTELYMSTNLPDVTLCDQLYLIKFLKQVLQFTENMATNTSIEHNKWSEGLTLVTSFLKKVTNFYEKQKF